MGVGRWLASLTFLLGVPVSVWLTFEGHSRGFYSYGAIPIVFAVVVAVLFAVVLFGVLPLANRPGN